MKLLMFYTAGSFQILSHRSDCFVSLFGGEVVAVVVSDKSVQQCDEN